MKSKEFSVSEKFTNSIVNCKIRDTTRLSRIHTPDKLL